MKPRLMLQPGETLEREFRTTRVVWLPAWTLSIFLILGAFFFMVRLFGEGAVGIALFTVLLVLGVWMGGRAWMQFARTQLIVTSDRVIAIRQKGLLEFISTEIPLRSIGSISFRRKGLFQALFRYGKLKVETKGESGRMIFDALPRPERVQELLYCFLHDEPRV